MIIPNNMSMGMDWF